MYACITSLALIISQPPDVPQLAGECTWGVVTQIQNRIFIEGGCWRASGRIEEGRLHVAWLYGSEGRPAAGLYEIVVQDDGRARVSGEWWWVDVPGTETKSREVFEIELDPRPPKP